VPRDWTRRPLHAAVVIATTATIGAWTQKPTADDAAAKLSGTWKINRELSPSVGGPGRGRGGPSFAIAGTVQRGGGGRGGDTGPGPSGPGDLTPEERGNQDAMRLLQQIPETIVIAASPSSVTFTDPRGARTFGIDGKTATIVVATAKIGVKTKWDKLALRQEFSSPQRKLIQSWTVDESDHLVLKARLESLSLSTPEMKAVFNRQ
jgi:hypothetical protein